RPSVKRIAAISMAALAAAWLVGLVVTLRDAADALPTFGGGFDRTGEHIDAVPLGAEAADTAAAEVAGRDDLPSLAPPEQHPGSPANKSAWRCNFGPSSSCKRFRGESVDAAWAA